MATEDLPTLGECCRKALLAYLEIEKEAATTQDIEDWCRRWMMASEVVRHLQESLRQDNAAMRWKAALENDRD